MGAIGEDGITIVNNDVVRLAHVSEDELLRKVAEHAKTHNLEPTPELVVTRGGAPFLTFTSEACWVIGAGGWVRVRAPSGVHKLVYVNSILRPNGWRLYRSDWPRPPRGQRFMESRHVTGVPFERGALEALAESADG